MPSPSYRYYSIYRPVDIGTYPKGGVVNIVNFDSRSHVESINRSAWGYIEYDRELTQDEISSFELVPEMNA